MSTLLVLLAACGADGNSPVPAPPLTLLTAIDDTQPAEMVATLAPPAISSGCTGNCQCGCNQGGECCCDVRLAVARKQAEIDAAARRHVDNARFVSISTGPAAQQVRIEGYIRPPAGFRYNSAGLHGGAGCGTGCSSMPQLVPLHLSPPLMAPRPMLMAPLRAISGGC